VIRGAFDRLIIVQHATATTDDHGGEELTWTELEKAYARVRFGLADEKRQAAQESASQSATFEVAPTSTLLTVSLKDRIQFDNDNWDIVEVAPLARNLLRFTALRSKGDES